MFTSAKEVLSFIKKEGVQFVDTEAWFCALGECPAVIGDYIAHRDASHISGSPTQANRPWRSATENGEPPSAIEVTLELDSTITRPKPTSASVAPRSR